MTAGIPVLKTSPKIWGVLGGALYRARPLLPVTLREIYQNSRDACRGLERKPEIVITLETDEFRAGILTCEDNGCGMSEETLLTKFLVLGESEKTAGSTGGWGIAKASTLGGACRWELWTNQLHLSSEHLEEGRPIDHVAPIVGTRIVLEYEPFSEHDPRRGLIGLSPGALARGISWLLHSDTPCVVRLRCQGKEIIWQSPGLVATEDSRLCGEQEGKTAWRLHQLPTLDVPPVECRGLGSHAILSAGQVFYRLAGLAQFCDSVSSSHQDTFVVDVETHAHAGDSDYPFVPSRESVTGELPCKIEAVLSPHKMNPLTSMSRKRDRHRPPDVIYYDGAPLGRQAQVNKREHDRLGMAQRLVAPEVALSHASIAQPIRVEGRFVSPVGVRLLFKGASRTKREVLSVVNRRFLLTWGRIIDLVMEANHIQEEFGIGFLFHETEAAERHVDDTGVYFLVNPNLVSLRSSKPTETLLRMFLVAAHEVAHGTHADHTESFTSWMQTLADAAIPLFLQRQRELKHVLQGRYPLPAMEVVGQLPLEL
jgi:hypothetical protein